MGQVEGVPKDAYPNKLRVGISLKDGLILPASINRIKKPKIVWLREPPIRIRKSVADSWLEIIISEG